MKAILSHTVASCKSSIQSIPRRLLNPRRPKHKPTSEEQEEMLLQYDAVLPDDARLVLSHNYEVHYMTYIRMAARTHALHRSQTSVALLPLHHCWSPRRSSLSMAWTSSSRASRLRARLTFSVRTSTKCSLC
jgi:hypothetical protein